MWGCGWWCFYLNSQMPFSLGHPRGNGRNDFASCFKRQDNLDSSSHCADLGEVTVLVYKPPVSMLAAWVLELRSKRLFFSTLAPWRYGFRLERCQSEGKKSNTKSLLKRFSVRLFWSKAGVVFWYHTDGLIKYKLFPQSFHIASRCSFPPQLPQGLRGNAEQVKGAVPCSTACCPIPQLLHTSSHSTWQWQRKRGGNGLSTICPIDKPVAFWLFYSLKLSLKELQTGHARKSWALDTSLRFQSLGFPPPLPSSWSFSRIHT